MWHYGFMPSLESDSDNIREVFMLGQNGPLADQTDQEIADAATAEITTSKKLTKDAKRSRPGRSQYHHKVGRQRH
jgi:hypothetical protein